MTDSYVPHLHEKGLEKHSFWIAAHLLSDIRIVNPLDSLKSTHWKGQIQRSKCFQAQSGSERVIILFIFL